MCEYVSLVSCGSVTLTTDESPPAENDPIVGLPITSFAKFTGGFGALNNALAMYGFPQESVPAERKTRKTRRPTIHLPA